jgi:hypothetical protein
MVPSKEPVSVTITAAAGNATPIANAGQDRTVLVGTTINLDGSRSTDADGDPIAYAWSLVARPAGSAATLGRPESASPEISLDVEGNYVVRLVVSDGSSTSAASEVTLRATRNNVAPVARAGASQSVLEGSKVTLDGTASSDPNGDALSYSWSFVSRPTGSTASLSSPDSADPSFVADRTGSHVVALIVGDGALVSETRSTTITANPLPVVVGVELLLYGGFNNSEYLGCLTCNSFHLESVCNRYGSYGSPYGLNSIWNLYGNYGSPYDLYSPWNSYSISGPIIMGTNGVSYGRFTVNSFQYDRTTVQLLRNVLNFYSSTNSLDSTRTFARGN